MSPTRQLQEAREAWATTGFSGLSAKDNQDGGSRPSSSFSDTQERTVASEDLATEVLFPEARRLRRRRWTIGAALVTAALIVVGLVFARGSLSSAKLRPTGTTTPYALSATSVGTARLYFRPVDCIIAPFYWPPSAKPPSVPRGTRTNLADICKDSATAQAEYNAPNGNKYGVTPPQDDNANNTVLLPSYTGYSAGRFVLGPAQMSGSIIKTAHAALDSQTDEWEVNITFTAAGSTEFNKNAAAPYKCYEEDTSNPPYCALQAIELNGTVLSAPSVDSKNFPGSAVISGSSSEPFTKTQAMEIAAELRSASKMAPISG
jgi:hypothetical protein